MHITTVKLHESTKSALSQLREKNDSYDDIISRLVSQSRHKVLKNELIEGYKRLGKEDIRVLKEWETASQEVE